MIYINNFGKLTVSFIFLLLLGVMASGAGLAKEEKKKSEDVTITITNDQTGEVTTLDPEETKKNTKVNQIKTTGHSKTLNYDVLIPLDEIAGTLEDPSIIRPLDITGGSKTAGGISAKLNVDYDVRGETIKVKRVYGSWTPTSSMYYVSTRKVEWHSGVYWGNQLLRHPPNNSFSYTVDWNYNQFAFGQASPRAWSSAKGHISGMTSTYTISLEVAFP